MSDSRRSESSPESDAPIPFEASLERLESIVAKLERGDLELEVALAAFEEGVSLARGCATSAGSSALCSKCRVSDSSRIFSWIIMSP